MGQVWTRAKWNDIIQRVNDLIGPCDYADYLDPLPEVEAGHIWSATDISVVRNRLMYMCRNAPESDEWCERVKWKQDIIDELNEVIDNCDCGCTQAVVNDARSIHGRSSYVPYLIYPQQFTKTEWFDGDHWHFYWTYRQNYDFTIAIGYGYGWSGLNNVGHLAKWHIEYWLYPYQGAPTFHSDVFELGVVSANCDGVITSAPSGTFVWTSPVDVPMYSQPGGYPFTVWDTANASCC